MNKKGNFSLTENLEGEHVPPVPPRFLRLCNIPSKNFAHKLTDGEDCAKVADSRQVFEFSWL